MRTVRICSLFADGEKEKMQKDPRRENRCNVVDAKSFDNYISQSLGKGGKGVNNNVIRKCHHVVPLQRYWCCCRIHRSHSFRKPGHIGENSTSPSEHDEYEGRPKDEGLTTNQWSLCPTPFLLAFGSAALRLTTPLCRMSPSFTARVFCCIRHTVV